MPLLLLFLLLFSFLLLLLLLLYVVLLSRDFMTLSLHASNAYRYQVKLLKQISLTLMFPFPPPPSPCRNENHFSICYFSACVILVYLDFPSLPPRLGRHFRHHYLHGIECSSTLSNVPGRRSKNIKTQINSRQIRSRHTRTHTHTYTHSYIHMQICKVTRATHRNMQTISAA